MKGQKTGGRKAGTPNKRNLKVDEIAAKYDTDPFDILMMVATGDWERLKLSHPDDIELKERVQAAKEACKYLYAQKQAIKLDLNEIHAMSDEEFEVYKANLLKQYAPIK